MALHAWPHRASLEPAEAQQRPGRLSPKEEVSSGVIFLSAILFEFSANKLNKINTKICPWMFSWKLAAGFVHSMLVPSLPKPACPKAQDQVMPPQFQWLMHGLSQLSERDCSTQMQVCLDSAMMLRYSIILNPDAQGRSTGGQQKRFPMESILQWVSLQQHHATLSSQTSTVSAGPQ